MLSTGIPELQSVDDITYLREAFEMDLTEEKAREKFRALIYESLDTKTTLFNNAIHILARMFFCFSLFVLLCYLYYCVICFVLWMLRVKLCCVIACRNTRKNARIWNGNVRGKTREI